MGIHCRSSMRTSNLKYSNRTEDQCTQKSECCKWEEVPYYLENIEVTSECTVNENAAKLTQ